MKEARGKIDLAKIYTLPEAIQLVKETAKLKFDAGIELHVNLGIDKKKSEEMVRSVASLPYGTGKTIKIAAFVPDNLVEKAKEAGADVAGNAALIEEIKKTEKCDFDIAVATPDMMKSLAAVARILGQKGLMPNPKTGTIAPDIAKLIKELKLGKVSYKSDTGGSVHVLCGKVSFSDEHLIANIEALIDSIKRAKPATMKGNYLMSAYLTSTMGPSVRVAL